jgi:DNA-binding NtrC family response regulator
MKSYILVVDDDKIICDIVRSQLLDEGYEVNTINHGHDAIEKVKERQPDLIIQDIQMPDINGLDTITEIKKIYPKQAFIFLTAMNSVDMAVEAMKIGAIDFLLKPFNTTRLKTTVNNAIKTTQLENEVESLKSIVIEHSKLDEIVGSATKTLELKEKIKKTFNLDSTVLLLGESGTGKELVARTIHNYSTKRDTTKFVAVNCASLPENLLESELFGHEKGAFTGAQDTKIGKFEFANGGTLLLDEICEMSFNTQAKLMRVLQEREIQRIGSNEMISIDIRVIAATNKNIEEYVREGKFREDLYFRLNVFPITLPPLRERCTDIEELCEYFINKLNHKFLKNIEHISAESLSALEDYSWPGNIREMQNVIERAMIECEGDTIELSHLPQHIVLENQNNKFKILQNPDKTGLSLPEIVEQIETEMIKQALTVCQGNLSDTAKKLNIGRSTLYRKIELYDIKLDNN